MFYGRGKFFSSTRYKNVFHERRVAGETNEKHKTNNENFYRVLAHAEANNDRKSMNEIKHTLWRWNQTPGDEFCYSFLKLQLFLFEKIKVWRVINLTMSQKLKKCKKYEAEKL